MALPLPATGEILVSLDDRAHARLRVLVLALNSECDAPHKVFRQFYIFWRGDLPERRWDAPSGIYHKREQRRQSCGPFSALRDQLTGPIALKPGGSCAL